jgi:hypothetical protein
MNRFASVVRANLTKTVGGVLVALASIVGLGAYSWTGGSAVQPKAALAQPEGAAVQTEFTVGSGKFLGQRVGLLLNEGIYPNHTATIHVPVSAKGFTEDVNSLIGHKIKVKGVVSSYKGKRQIEASEITVQ